MHSRRCNHCDCHEGEGANDQRSATEAVAEYMRRLGTDVFVHHSAVSKEERLLAEERFHHGSNACIVNGYGGYGVNIEPRFRSTNRKPCST